MYAIRDRVYEKLTKLFSDSQSPRETIDQDSEARQYAKDGKSQSSILSFVLPSASLDWFRPNRGANEVKFTESNSFKWRSKSFSWKDKPLDTECKDKDKLDSHLENGEPGSGTSSSNSSDDVFEDAASTPHTFDKPAPRRLLDESIFVTQDLYQFFEASLPNIVKGCEWVLFTGGSTAKHGISLHTLVRKSALLNGPCLLITGDKQGAIFGGLLDCPLKPTSKRKYQGTNQTFVFSTLYGEPRLFRPTGANRYFYLCLNNLLALGGGGNSCLAHDQEFEIKNVELWGFTHASQYLNY
ncbi:hypothetical protein CASFOL_042188 [Castilleja foliolosa]|uniref:TLDc domain-containing protein n=1 Tax=Castilleja foliolosa TaxID=1961234 RepID=A0ABD3BA24_9LAMI